jgi:hypothetical protein
MWDVPRLYVIISLEVKNVTSTWVTEIWGGKVNMVSNTINMKSIIFWDMTPCSLLSTTGWFAELFFDPEDGGDMFLRNVGCYPTDYTASYPRR